jgi:hypothetical protein
MSLSLCFCFCFCESVWAIWTHKTKKTFQKQFVAKITSSLKIFTDFRDDVIFATNCFWKVFFVLCVQIAQTLSQKQKQKQRERDINSKQHFCSFFFCYCRMLFVCCVIFIIFRFLSIFGFAKRRRCLSIWWMWYRQFTFQIIGPLSMKFQATS